MARKVPDDRLERLVACASAVFIEQGYRRTQMADVARAMGIAKGTLYLYVESKAALFDLVLRCADAAPGAWPPLRFPVPAPRAGATLRYVRGELTAHAAIPSLTAALVRRRVPDAGSELRGILGDLYDVLARNRCRIKLVDRCARDYPELAALWFEGARDGVLDLLTRYLAARIRSGHLRAVPDVPTAARLVLETTVFWAVHRHWDAHPQAIGDAIARETVVHFVLHTMARPGSKE
jgi:AcrR family transcriptional regulator